MSAWDLDTAGNEKVLKNADMNLHDPDAPEQPSFFTGFGSASGSGIMKGGARTAQTLTMAGAVPVIAYDAVAGTDYQKGYFENVVDGVANNAVDYWTADAATTGTAGRITNSLGEIVIPLMLGGGNPIPLVATQQMGVSTDLVREGVDPETASVVGGATGFATALGFKAPAAIGTNLLTKATSGAAINVGLGAATDAASGAILSAGGHDEIAERYSATNPEGRAVDAGMGIVFGILHAPRAKPLKPSETNAILTERNNQHFVSDSAPGIFADAEAQASHQSALSKSFEQLSKGEPVNVELSGQFKQKPINASMQQAFRNAAIEVVPDLAANNTAARSKINPAVLKKGHAQDVVNYAAKVGYPPEWALLISSIETGGRFNPGAKNPESSAHGLFQVLNGTWKQFKGGDRSSVQEQLRVGLANLKDTKGYMAKNLGRDISLPEMYLGQLLGPRGAVHTLKADRNRPLIDVVREFDQKNATAIVKNNGMNGMTVGQAIDKWQAATKAHARKAGIDVGPGYDSAPTNRGIWEAEVRPHLYEVGMRKGVELGHIDEINTAWRAVEAGDNTPKVIRFDFMDAEGAQRVMQSTGLNLEGYHHTVNKDALNHIRNEHSLKIKPGQEPITQRDIERIPEVVRSYDNVERVTRLDDSGKATEPERIRYSKGYDDGSVLYVEEVSTKRKTLTTKSMYKHKPSKTQQGRISETMQQEAPNLSTPKTPDGLTPVDASIIGQKPLITQANQGNIGVVDAPVMQAEPIINTVKLSEPTDISLLKEAAITMPDAEVTLSFDADGQPVKTTLSEALETIEQERAREIQDAKMYVSAAMCSLLKGG